MTRPVCISAVAGAWVGRAVGSVAGTWVGSAAGACVGSAAGACVGSAAGAWVGAGAGAVVAAGGAAAVHALATRPATPSTAVLSTRRRLRPAFLNIIGPSSSFFGAAGRERLRRPDAAIVP